MADIPKLIAESAARLPALDDVQFARAFDRYADRRVVLLGECSHGTSEFYRARAEITKRLVAEHGFTLVAVEADWPDAGAINRFVRHHAPRPKAEPVFQRFPIWMWRNVEVDGLIDWMRAFNEGKAREAQAGFYGLDMYNLSASIASVLDYLGQVDPEAASIARRRYGCLTPWQEDPAVYGRAVLTAGYRSCEEAVVEQCRELLQNRLEYAREGGEEFLDAAQNARLVAAAERYYRVMYYGDAESWNLRDTHMFETLENLLKAHGPQAKAVVWAHNSHIGDARFTDMGRRRGELNLGQLCRERFGGEAALIGLGTHAGTVAAAHDWGDEMQLMTVRPSLPDSVERLCHDAGLASFLLDLHDERVREALVDWRLERFIGVIYRPETERYSHYAGVSLPGQFDGYAWFDETAAVTPLGPQHARLGAPETYPFGL